MRFQAERERGGDKKPADGRCDAASTLDRTAIGFPAGCPGTPTAASVDCGDLPSGTLDEIIGCVDCVTSSTVDCADRGAVPAFALYPAECRP